MSKTQLAFMSIPWLLLLVLCVVNLVRVIQMQCVREWFNDHDYVGYCKLPKLDEMVTRHWKLWSVDDWQSYVRGRK